MIAISQIKDELNNCKIEELPVFMERYADDERSGVQALIKKAKKALLAYDTELARTEVMYSFEDKYKDYQAICGIDEVGRGPLAGPVVAGAVILPKGKRILYLNDSKQLSAAKREELYDVIMAEAIAVGIGVIDHERIDEVNILNATYEAMQMAVQKLSICPDILLNDAVTIPKLTMKQVPIIKGDAKSASIAAASIVAKVTRDRMMVEYDKIYPGYGFASNKGYGAASHIEAIQKLGPTPIHRKSFIGNFV